MTEETPGDDLRGFATIPRWLQRSKEATGPMKLVYISLSSYADERGQSWPSHATLAEESDCAPSTVKKALNALRAMGVVTWTKRVRDDSGQTSNLYQLHTSKPVENGVLPPSRGTATPSRTATPLAVGELPPSRGAATNENQVNEIRATTDDSSSAQVLKSVDNFSSRRGVPAPSPASVFGVHGTAARLGGIRWLEVLADVDRFFSGLADDDLAATGAEILRVATSRVVDPTRYVTKALQNDPLVWQQWAYEHMVDEYRADRMRGDLQ